MLVAQDGTSRQSNSSRGTSADLWALRRSEASSATAFDVFASFAQKPRGGREGRGGNEKGTWGWRGAKFANEFRTVAVLSAGPRGSRLVVSRLGECCQRDAALVMTASEFLDMDSAPASAIGSPLHALWLAHRGDWDGAHVLVQDNPSADAAWVHAHLHRVEGDSGNAAYWYRRAGRAVCDDGLVAERVRLAEVLLSKNNKQT